MATKRAAPRTKIDKQIEEGLREVDEGKVSDFVDSNIDEVDPDPKIPGSDNRFFKALEWFIATTYPGASIQLAQEQLERRYTMDPEVAESIGFAIASVIGQRRNG